MKTLRILTALSLIYVMPGFVIETVADDDKEATKPVPFPAAPPQLLAIMPAGVQQGTATEVTVSGRSLSPAEAVTVDGRGVTAELVPLPEGRRPSSSSIKVKLTATSDAAPGIHELRLRTSGGNSNVVRFMVGLLPQVTEVEPNNDDGTAERLLTLPVIVNGALNRGEDRDCFRFAARKGQTIVLDLCGQQLHPYVDRLRPGWLEAVLTVRDASEVAPFADENLAALKQVAEKTTAATRASAIAKSRRDSAQKAASDVNLASKDAAASRVAAQKAMETAQKSAAAVAKAGAELAEAQAKAAQIAASENGDTEKPAADQIVQDKAQALEQARETASDAKAASDIAAAKKLAAEKQLASRQAASKAAAAQSTAAADAYRKTAAELTAARKRAADAATALKEVVSPSVRNLAVASHFSGRYDPALTFTAPHDGEYLVEVRDDLYRGRAEFTYRLTVGELPFVTHVFPAGLKAGSKSSVSLGGVNLGDATSFPVTATSAGALDARHLEHVTTSLGPSNRFALQTGEAPEFQESEPNDEAEHATSVEVPATLNGVIEAAGDFDCYRFAANKGQKLVFETVSKDFGSPLDARLDLFDERGRRLKNNDDFNRLPDSRIDITIPADGKYVIRVGDTTTLGSPRHVYRLHVRPPRPDFALTVNPDNARVTAGGSLALTVMIQRLDGFKGDVEVTLPNAPAGAIVSPAVINNSQSQVTVSVTIPADAQPAVLPLTVEGRATIDDSTIVHQATPVERMRYINEWRYVPVGDLSLSVLPVAPFTLAWGQSDVTIVAGESVEIPVKVNRTPGFTDPIRLSLVGLPSRLYAPVVTIEKETTEATVEIRSSTSAPAGTGNAIASTTVKGLVQNSPALAIQVEVPEKK